MDLNGVEEAWLEAWYARQAATGETPAGPAPSCT
jgi:hypothetical protein